MMIESGLIAIQLGIESGSQRVLDAYAAGAPVLMRKLFEQL